MTRPTPRRPASSRGGTQRPRRIAGAAPTRADEEVSPAEVPEAPVEPDPAEPEVVEPEVVEPEVDEPEVDEPEVDEPEVDEAGPVEPSAPGVLARPKTTRVLIASLVLVAFALAAELGILITKSLTDDAEPASRDSRELVVPDGRPVVASEAAVLDGVESAAKAAQEIVAVDFQKYDAEVDKAADLMTTQFEDQYRKTAADISKDFIANKTVVQANVVAQGVVRASRTRLEALVFLNQVVSRERDGEPETVVTPFKVLVTMVHTDQGWLVDGLDTDAPQDKTN